MSATAESRVGKESVMGISKKTALLGGFGSVIAVLLFSSIEAYQIQKSVSEKHLDIYRRYVQQDAALSQLRRTIWSVGNYVRDFFINTGAEGAVLLKSQILELKAQSDQALDRLDQLAAVRRTRPEFVAALRQFWDTVDPIADNMLHKSKTEQYRFLQREIVPRRSSLYNTLREMTESDLSAIQQHEAKFAQARSSGARRLVLMLGLCVLLALAASRLSLTYAESLETETNRQYNEAIRAKAEQAQLSARLLDIEEEDKRKLSRELHDEIGQTLAILQIEISNALTAADGKGIVLNERLRQAHRLADRTVQTVRNIALLLRPALLDDLGLIPALQWQLENFLRRTGIRCELVDEGVEDALPDSVKTCVYRVVQEALHNCEKHANATEISVKLRQLPELLTAQVADNGCGFEMNEKSMPCRNLGLGILGMRERAAKVGGTLTLNTVPGKGTKLLLNIPLAQPLSSGDAQTIEATIGV
jgi:signal transduction histidine kinase